MEDVLKAIERGLENGLKLAQKSTREEFEAQGHNNTGKGMASITYEVERTGTSVIGTMWAEDYVVTLEFGIAAENIPFSPGSGAESSQYISGLITYFESKGLGENEATRAAFGTAHTHIVVGLPTNGSYAFSSTGERTGFAATALERNLETITNSIAETTGFELNIQIGEAGKMEPMVFYT